jgi:hypothetical protein
MAPVLHFHNTLLIVRLWGISPDASSQKGSVDLRSRTLLDAAYVEIAIRMRCGTSKADVRESGGERGKVVNPAGITSLV